MRPHIDYTNSQHPWRGVITHFNVAGRRKFYRAFMEAMAPTEETTILDVGVTPDQTAADSNYFEKWYPRHRADHGHEHRRCFLSRNRSSRSEVRADLG